MFALPSSIFAIFVALLLPILVRSDCECGYSVGSALYTDLIETDFLTADHISADWVPQTYTVTPTEARGPYGKSAAEDNVVPNPLKNAQNPLGEGTLGGDAGLQLIVRGGIPEDKLIPMAEVSTYRTDLLYGSFRAGMKMTGTNGTCAAFFWYFNDTQEIDMEFLSKEYSSNDNPVNLVLQSPDSARDGFDASHTGTFKVIPLPFPPSDGFHEYRFDWSPDNVTFYADGQLLSSMTNAVPTAAGHITLSHWSNGDPEWSAGPPTEDATVTVEYFKAYFNSSEPKRHDDWKRRCNNPTSTQAVCPVPEVTAPPDGTEKAKAYFFSQDKGKAVNQTVNGVPNPTSWAAPLPVVRWWLSALWAGVLGALFCL